MFLVFNVRFRILCVCFCVCVRSFAITFCGKIKIFIRLSCCALAGHLDRVVHGITAEEILDTCDEKTDASAGERLSNPTISIAQAVRRHNLATLRHMANQQIKRAQDALEPKITRTMHPNLVQRVLSTAPFMVQGLRTNTRDPDSHVVYFDTEALIGTHCIVLRIVWWYALSGAMHCPVVSKSNAY